MTTAAMPSSNTVAAELPDVYDPVNTGESRIAIRIAEALPWLMLPPGMSCQFVEHPALAAIPNVRPWFAGAYAERGVISPIFNFSHWLDQQAPDHPTHKQERTAYGHGLVVIRDRAELIGFLCIETPKLLSVDVGTDTTDNAGEPAIQLPDAIRPFTGCMHRAGRDICVEFQPFAWVRVNAARISIAT